MAVAAFAREIDPALAQPVVRRHRLDALVVHAIPASAQVREGRVWPLRVDLHDSASRPDMVDVSCAIGATSASASVRGDALGATASVTLALPDGTQPRDAPRGPHRVRCVARVRGARPGAAGDELTAERELDIDAPRLPDYALRPHPVSVSSQLDGFDCETHAPAVAGRGACVAFSSEAPGGETVVRCTLDGVALARQPGPYHDGPLPIGSLAAGSHTVSCVSAPTHPAWEVDPGNNRFDATFEVLSASRWQVDLALTRVGEAARAAEVHPPTSNPTGSTYAPSPGVAGVAIDVGFRNAGRTRVYAVEATCHGASGGAAMALRGTWARPQGDRAGWLRGLAPGESATVAVTAAGALPAGRMDLSCEVRTAAPREVPEATPADNRLRATVMGHAAP